MDEAVILRTMAERGLRITGQRRSLARLFAEADGYLTPKEIYEDMEAQYPGLSFDTVYRNLRVMQELGVIEQIMFEDGVRFKVHCGGEEHHHHLICLSCERTLPIRYCPMPDLAELPDSFRVVRHKFEVFGYCRECQEEGGDGAGPPDAEGSAGASAGEGGMRP
jgi:Fur family zinc uptake transcriptional regulator